MDNYDFSGWATRNNIKCSDGRTIMQDAFADQDGTIVPLVWNHQHNDNYNVLGHAMLQNRPEGVYTYGKFNDTESGQNAKLLVENGDVSALSIYANQLKQQAGNVVHGAIREVSLVLAGANPGAYIDAVMSHGEESDEEAIMQFVDGEHSVELFHAEEPSEEKKDEPKEEKKEMADAKEKTVGEVFETLTEEQKTAVYAMIGAALEEGTDEKGENADMKHNVFDNDNQNDDVLMHDALDTIIKDGKRYGSLKESFMAHSQTYGIENIDYLFPEAKTVSNTPEFIQREMGWVQKVMNGVHHTPFSRIKSVFADITEDEARARGYIKGKLKKEEVFSLLKRTTTPTTIYKKQKLDRDDVIDITDFDVVAWLKSEMRMMLDEEIARAILIGDGRLSSSDDKINETNIRPIATDTASGVYAIEKSVGANGAISDYKDVITAAVRARIDYKGSGTPTLFTTEEILTELLLLEDGIGHRLYKTEAELASAMRVKEIVTVPVMEGTVYAGIIVNLNDYNVGADKGGAVNMFDDFDIDYNAQKYLIETRCSGALVKPHSAIVLKIAQSA